jgi:hypothetical protein
MIPDRSWSIVSEAHSDALSPFMPAAIAADRKGSWDLSVVAGANVIQ